MQNMGAGDRQSGTATASIISNLPGVYNEILNLQLLNKKFNSATELMSNQLPVKHSPYMAMKIIIKSYDVIVFFVVNNSRIKLIGLFSTAPAPRIPRAGLLWLHKFIVIADLFVDSLFFMVEI